MADPHELLLPEVRLLWHSVRRERERTGAGKELSAPEPPNPAKVDRAAFLALFLVLLAFTVVLMVASMPAGSYAIYSGRLSTSFSAGSLFPAYYWVGPYSDPAPFEVSVGAMFAILTAVYAAFLVYSSFENGGPIRALRASFREGVGALATSPFVAMVLAIGVLNFAGTEIDDVVAMAGGQIGGPSSSADPLALLAGFTYAPFVEELGFRVLLIGVVAFILSISRPWKDAVGALWRPSRALEGLAFGSGASIIIWAATGFSALTFGACHVMCGGGAWQIGKLPEATFGGVVLGYLYVRYGFHVAVLAHWGVDFFGSAFSFFGQAAYGIPWYSGTTEYIGQHLVDWDMLYLFGLVSFLLVVYLCIRRLAAGRRASLFDEFNGPAYGGGIPP